MRNSAPFLVYVIFHNGKHLFERCAKIEGTSDQLCAFLDFRRGVEMRIDASRIERHQRERTLSTQNCNQSFERFPDRRGVLNQSYAHKIGAGIGSVTTGLGQESPRYDLDAHTFP